MASVRSTGNKSTELRAAALFRASGITGWRRQYQLPGRPDFVFLKARLAVFVDGCFWHGCPRCYRSPKSNQEFWDAKVRSNVVRDKLVNGQLRRREWKVLRLWGHDLIRKRAAVSVRRLRKALGIGRGRSVPT
jgi:DNA mismatch endonuclease (patch repair protein)